jgi:uncharacterized protein (DUF488 family)
MKFRENSVQICLIVQLFITIVELHLVLRQPAEESFSFLIFKMLEYYQIWYTGTQNIFTIGSNGKKIPEFIGILKKNGVETVLDVRKSATRSHVPAFNAKFLSDELTKFDIKYFHKEELGMPYEIVQSYTNKKPIDRKEQLTDMDFEGYYRDRISDEIDIDKLVEEIKGYGKTVLLCACVYAVKQGKQKHNCHRSILANILFETREFKEIIHL